MKKKHLIRIAKNNSTLNKSLVWVGSTHVFFCGERLEVAKYGDEDEDSHDLEDCYFCGNSIPLEKEEESEFDGGYCCDNENCQKELTHKMIG